MFIAFILLPGGALNHKQNENALLMRYDKIIDPRIFWDGSMLPCLPLVQTQVKVQKITLALGNSI